MARSTTIRMTAPTLLVSLTLLGVAGAAAWYMHRLQRDTSKELLDQLDSTRAAEQLFIDFRDIRLALVQFLDTGETFHLQEIAKRRRTLEEHLIRTEELAATERERELLRQARQGVKHFLDRFEALAPRDDSDALALADDLRMLAYHVIPEEILAPAGKYFDLTKSVAERISDENDTIANRMAYILLLIGVCGAVAGVLAGFAITRRITRAMIQLNVPVTDTAGKLGEVVGPITLSGGWEFSDLQASMESIGSQVAAVVERLQRSQRDALRAEQLAAVGQLAAGMAHELRNPLTSMKLLVQGASRDGSVGLHGRDLAVFGEEITRVEYLVQTLLDFARPPQPNRTSFNLAELVKETANFVAPQAEPKNIRLQCRLPKFPVWIKADQGQIRQVLLNLLLNALDAVPDNGAIGLEVLLCSDHARPKDAPVAADSQLCSEDNLSIRVADDGPGVPVELADRLFDPFVSSKPTGIGLGLSICKRIVEAHGGTMSAENSPGGGAVFSVHLPLTPLSPDHCAKANLLSS